MPVVRPLLTAAAAAALAVLLLACWGPRSARRGSSPALQHQKRRLGGVQRSAELKLHMCSVAFAGSTGRFELSFPSNPETGQFELIPGMQEFYVKTITIVGPPPTGIAITALMEDGLCLKGLSLDGVEAQGRLPLWLDDPCLGDGYEGIPCTTQQVWQLHTTTSSSTTTTATVTTTRSTTTTTATTTVTTTTATATTTTTTTMTTSATSTTTSTTTSSSTVSSTTSSTTTTATATSSTTTTSTTSTTTLYVLAPTPVRETPLVALAAATVPPAFFDELHAELDISINWTLNESHQLSVFEGPIAEAVTRFVGLAPPSSMRCSLRLPSSDMLVASLDMRIQPGTNMSAEDVRERLHDPVQRARLNALLALIAPPGTAVLGYSEADVNGQASLDSSGSFRMSTCGEGAIFCCVHAVVDSIVHNAGVVHAYRHYFILAMVLSAAVGLVWLWVAFPCPCKHGIQSEEERGCLVMPIFAIVVFFQAMLFTIKSIEKYYLLVDSCNRDLPLGSCPPSPSAMVVEVLVFGGGLALALPAFLVWWRRNWRADCRAERLQRRLRRHVVSPLESILRRTDFFACHEVRATDKASRTEHILVLVLSVHLSLAVTLTSFFALQRYSLPSGLTAWYPYKLIYELVIACALKIAMRKVVRSKMLGSFTFAFLCSSIALVGTLNTWLWITIGRTFFDLERGFDTWTFMRLLDICAGAGILNCILSPLGFSLSMYLFSAYVYEPSVRYNVKRCVHLTNPEVQVTEVTSLLDKDEDGDSEGSWEVAGLWTARGERVRLPALLVDDSSEGDEAAACCDPHGPTRSGHSAAHWASSLVGLAKAQPSRSQPLIVDLRRTDNVTCMSRLVCICDSLFSVDKKLPVMRRSCRDLSDLSMEDEDNYESSDSDGLTPSASDSTGSTDTGTESSEEGLSRPLRSGGWRFGRP